MQRNAGKIWRARNGGRSEFARRKFAAISRAVFGAGARQLSDEALAPRLHLDAEIGLAEINFDLLHWHEMLQPFGNGNPQPIFVCSAVEAARPPRMVGERHLELRLKKTATRSGAPSFSMALSLRTAAGAVGRRFSHLHPNIYEGETRIDLHVKALRSAASLD